MLGCKRIDRHVKRRIDRPVDPEIADAVRPGVEAIDALVNLRALIDLPDQW